MHHLPHHFWIGFQVVVAGLLQFNQLIIVGQAEAVGGNLLAVLPAAVDEPIQLLLLPEEGVVCPFFGRNPRVSGSGKDEVPIDLNVLETFLLVAAHQAQTDNAVISSQKLWSDRDAECAGQLHLELIDTVIAGQRELTVIVGQVAAAAEAGDGGDSTTRLGYPDLFAQTLRGISENSEQGLAGSQIKCHVRIGQLIGVAFSKLYAVG